jgi:acyl dehydratase
MSDRIEAALALVQAQLGEVRRSEIGSISPLWARRFALASAETDPIFFDDEAAAAAGYAGTPLPPLLLSSTRSFAVGPDRDGLSEDGVVLTDVGYPAGSGLRTLGGGQSLRFHADALAGVELAVEAEIRSASTKEGRSGELLIVEVERRFLTADGELLVTCDETRLLR